MPYKMRTRAGGVNGDKGRKGERSESEGREGEVGKLKGGGKDYLFIFVQVVVALCICQNIDCLTG